MPEVWARPRVEKAGTSMMEVRHCDNMDPAVGLPSLADASVDAVVTDPPAGIGFMGREWDKDKGGREQWVAWLAGVMRECLRVLKPGGHALVWALPRTSHWTATALELAGFELRDRIAHVFASGFPKSLDVSKAIDAKLDATRQRGPVDPARAGRLVNQGGDYETDAGWSAGGRTVTVDPPATPEAAAWDGWGTALKPAVEDWWLARKPLDGTVAENVLRWGTGGLNIGACRVGEETTTTIRSGHSGDHGVYGGDDRKFTRENPPGRWPAHLILGDEEAQAMLDAQSGVRISGSSDGYSSDVPAESVALGKKKPLIKPIVGSSGGASRFFYCPKPARSETERGMDRLEVDEDEEARNTHPTKKAVALMRYLCRLVTPPGGLVLDPFAGSGSTGVACAAERFRFLGMEQDAEFVSIARARLTAATAQQVMPW